MARVTVSTIRLVHTGSRAHKASSAFRKPKSNRALWATSGASPNVIRAAKVARARGITVVGLLGKGGGALKSLCDVSIVVPEATTSDRIQELHIKVIHITIEAVERRLCPENYA